MVGTWMAGTTGFQSAVFPLQIDGLTIPGYAALYALATNVVLCIVLSLIFNEIGATKGSDQTVASDYRFR
jgi:SSS family solute:Na+ symporter